MIKRFNQHQSIRENIMTKKNSNATAKELTGTALTAAMTATEQQIAAATAVIPDNVPTAATPKLATKVLNVNTNGSTLELMPIADIQRDKGTQIRQKLNGEWIGEIATYLKEVEDSFNKIDPIELIRDDAGNVYPVDGFHRIGAHEKAGYNVIRAIVRNGTLRDAILAAIGANSKHGLRRTAQDKRNAVVAMFNDDVWLNKPDTWIADTAGVSSMFVGNLRKELGFMKTDEGYTDKSGRTYADGSGAGRKGDGGIDDEGDGGIDSNDGATATPTMGPVKDKYGRTIPEQARGAFAMGLQLMNIVDGLRAARKSYKLIVDAVKVSGNATVAHVLDYEKEIQDSMTIAQNTILNHVSPFAVCPYCKVGDSNCPACEGSGFVSKVKFFQAPDELQKTDATAGSIGYWEALAEAEETARIEAEEKAAKKAAELEAKKTVQGKAIKGKGETLPNAAPKPGKRKGKATSYDPAIDLVREDEAGSAAATLEAVEGTATVNADDLPF